MIPALKQLYDRLPPLLVQSRLSDGMKEKLIDLSCRTFGARFRLSAGRCEVRQGSRIMRLSRDHMIYARMLARYFSVYFDSVVPTEENGFQVVDYSYPHLQTFRASGLEMEVAGFPEEEHTIADYFRWYEPQPGDTVFDIGANCGLSVYHLARRVGPTGKVYAFEPDPTNYAVLLRNIARHRMDNVTALQNAVAATSGKLEFFSEGSIGSTLASSATRQTVGSINLVDALSLADAIERFGVPRFVKMDIEGAEVDVLAAARDVLRAFQMELAIDTNHWRGGELTSRAVEALLRECGYETKSSDESGFMTTWGRPPCYGVAPDQPKP